MDKTEISACGTRCGRSENRASGWLTTMGRLPRAANRHQSPEVLRAPGNLGARGSCRWLRVAMSHHRPRRLLGTTPRKRHTSPDLAAVQLMDPDPAHRAPPPHSGHPVPHPGPQPRIIPHIAAGLRDLVACGRRADRCAPRSKTPTRNHIRHAPNRRPAHRRRHPAPHCTTLCHPARRTPHAAPRTPHAARRAPPAADHPRHEEPEHRTPPCRSCTSPWPVLPTASEALPNNARSEPERFKICPERRHACRPSLAPQHSATQGPLYAAPARHCVEILVTSGPPECCSGVPRVLSATSVRVTCRSSRVGCGVPASPGSLRLRDRVVPARSPPGLFSFGWVVGGGLRGCRRRLGLLAVWQRPRPLDLGA